MENPNIKTKVVHSESKDAWNVVGTKIPGKFKIARIPYFVIGNDIIDTKNKAEALLHAEFISRCFNSSDKIISTIFSTYGN
jgi:hypothetical protein